MLHVRESVESGVFRADLTGPAAASHLRRHQEPFVQKLLVRRRVFQRRTEPVPGRRRQFPATDIEENPDPATELHILLCQEIS